MSKDNINIMDNLRFPNSNTIVKTGIYAISSELSSKSWASSKQEENGKCFCIQIQLRQGTKFAAIHNRHNGIYCLRFMLSSALIVSPSLQGHSVGKVKE